MSEDRGARLVWWIAGAILLGLVAYHFVPRMENPLAPTPAAAFVAVLPEGATVASDGAHRLETGHPFRLCAVLEAKRWNGEPIYYTDAPGLELRGSFIPPRQLRRWPADKIARVRWFTVEANRPFLRVDKAEDFDQLVLRESFHPEWGDSWSVDGVVDPRLAGVPADSQWRPLPFGIQRYEVRVELFADPAALIPEQRFTSSPPEAFLAGEPNGTLVEVRRPGALATLSANFGKTEVATADAPAAAVRARLEELTDRRLVFTAAELLAAHIDASGRRPEDLDWHVVEIGRGRLEWGRDVSAGDLLQAGDRIVALFDDQGEAGKLDPVDLVIDLDQGLHLRRLDQVFASSDGLELSLARLTR